MHRNRRFKRRDNNSGQSSNRSQNKAGQGQGQQGQGQQGQGQQGQGGQGQGGQRHGQNRFRARPNQSSGRAHNRNNRNAGRNQNKPQRPISEDIFEATDALVAAGPDPMEIFFKPSVPKALTEMAKERQQLLATIKAVEQRLSFSHSEPLWDQYHALLAKDAQLLCKMLEAWS